VEKNKKIVSEKVNKILDEVKIKVIENSCYRFNPKGKI
jgi:hypothetical protein